MRHGVSRLTDASNGRRRCTDRGGAGITQDLPHRPCRPAAIDCLGRLRLVRCGGLAASTRYLITCRKISVPRLRMHSNPLVFSWLHEQRLLDGYLMGCRMTTDTSELGFEQLTCTALTGHLCNPPKEGSAGMTHPGYGCVGRSTAAYRDHSRMVRLTGAGRPG